MSDDIVTRLRELIPLPLQFSDESAPAHLISEAADEIERLRKEVDNLRAENQRLSQIARY